MSMIVAAVRAIVVMVVTAAMVVIAVMVMVMVMAMVVIAVVGYIAWIVFPRSHEVHGPIAGVVFLAMLAPILGVSRRHVQVHGRRRISLRHYQHRLCIDERRGPFTADLNLAVDARCDLTR
jgi:Na+/H+ antiporter NhaA